MQECLEEVLYDEPQQLRVKPVAERRKKVIDEIAQGADAAALLNLPDKYWDGFTQRNVVSQIQALIKESETLPEMTLYLPVLLEDKQLSRLAEWARREVAPGLMFDVLIDPSVVGGCAFVYNDVHFDWSLRRYLRAKRGLVTSLLNSYDE